MKKSAAKVTFPNEEREAGYWTTRCSVEQGSNHLITGLYDLVCDPIPGVGCTVVGEETNGVMDSFVLGSGEDDQNTTVFNEHASVASDAEIRVVTHVSNGQNVNRESGVIRWKFYSPMIYDAPIVSTTVDTFFSPAETINMRKMTDRQVQAQTLVPMPHGHERRTISFSVTFGILKMLPKVLFSTPPT